MTFPLASTGMSGTVRVSGDLSSEAVGIYSEAEFADLLWRPVP